VEDGKAQPNSLCGLSALNFAVFAFKNFGVKSFNAKDTKMAGKKERKVKSEERATRKSVYGDEKGLNFLCRILK